jgi:hypothetical protein
MGYWLAHGVADQIPSHDLVLFRRMVFNVGIARKGKFLFNSQHMLEPKVGTYAIFPFYPPEKS